MITSTCLSIVLGIIISLACMIKAPPGHNDYSNLLFNIFILICIILSTPELMPLPLMIQNDAQTAMLSAIITRVIGFALDTTNSKINHRFVIFLAIITVILGTFGIIAPLLPKF